MTQLAQNQLAKKDLAQRWHVSVRSVERIRKRYNLPAAGFFGRQPYFDLPAVEAMEARRVADREQTLEAGKIITVREAKRRAKKGGRR